MPATLLLAMTVLPLLPCAMLLHAATRRWGLRLAPWTALPALALALAPTRWNTIDLPWLLLGTRLGLDATGRVFLLLTALVWLLAGLYARAWYAGHPGRMRFTAFFLLTQAGNLGVCVALDAASFYLFFALMTFGAYGLVAHEPRPAARRAGRVYLALAVLGEMLVLAGLLVLTHAAGSHLLPELHAGAAGHALQPLAALLLFVGFGAKTGLPLLHVALPPSYAEAPPPAAAVLAGAMIKAGVLGWLRFLPLGEAALPGAGAVLLVGLLMAGGGVAIGLCQRRPGALLAYSSISQMGYLTVAVGAALLAPRLWTALLPAVLLYALHHALAKAALFLGLGVAQRRGAGPWVTAGLALPALALAGAPLSSGALAKHELKLALAALPAPWGATLSVLLSLAAVGTALLVLRLLWLVHGRPPAPGAPPLPPAAVLSWSLLLAAVAALVALFAPGAALGHAMEPGGLWSAAWPLLAAALLAWVALNRGLRAPKLPPGDLLVPALPLLRTLGRRLRRWRVPPPSRPALPLRRGFWHRAEASLRTWPHVGLAWLALLAALALLALEGWP